MPKNKKLVFTASAVVAAVGTLLLFVTAHGLEGRIEPEIRTRLVRYLEQRFDSSVALEDLQIRLPRLSTGAFILSGGKGAIASVEGRNLSLRLKNKPERPPLLKIDSFSFDLDLGMLRLPSPTVQRVKLAGMTITIPPKSADKPPVSQHSAGGKTAMARVVIETVDITNARLIILPKRAEARPLDFALESINLTSAGIGEKMRYRASLTNPRPPGHIQSNGTFGPWNSENPGDTPLEGDYAFSNADLGVFPAIAGNLNSVGHFVGSLSAVTARGEATVPDFRLKTSGNRIPLYTQFDVLVDGTNGDTILQPVHARLGNTNFQTSGAVVKQEGESRRSIELDVLMPAGHIEDLLTLAAKGRPFMAGLVSFNAKIAIPPLSGSVKEKLFLSGNFKIARGEFQRQNVQNKVDELSRRGQGRPNDAQVAGIFSNMSGDFRLENQVLTFSRFNFAVPGAAVALHGNILLADSTLDLHGHLKLDAKVSQTLSGWKHWLAKPFDPIFTKNGAGTFLKIQVVGSADEPKFGRDHGGQ